MPNIKSAQKKLRQDRKRTQRNNLYYGAIKKTLHSIKKSVGKKDGSAELKKAYSIIDKAAKRKVIHKRKAARLKSRVSKLLIRSNKK